MSQFLFSALQLCEMSACGERVKNKRGIIISARGTATGAREEEEGAAAEVERQQ